MNSSKTCTTPNLWSNRSYLRRYYSLPRVVLVPVSFAKGFAGRCYRNKITRSYDIHTINTINGNGDK